MPSQADCAQNAGAPTFTVHIESASPLGCALLPYGQRMLGSLVHALLVVAKEFEQKGDCSGVPQDVELVLVDDAHMAALNAQAMGVSGPTNILSFPGMPLSSHASLVLSLQTFLRESLLYGQSTETCLLRLLAHGVGHICGFDHGSAMDAFCETLEQKAKEHVAKKDSQTMICRSAY